MLTVKPDPSSSPRQTERAEAAVLETCTLHYLQCPTAYREPPHRANIGVGWEAAELLSKCLWQMREQVCLNPAPPCCWRIGLKYLLFTTFGDGRYHAPWIACWVDERRDVWLHGDTTPKQQRRTWARGLGWIARSPGDLVRQTPRDTIGLDLIDRRRIRSLSNPIWVFLESIGWSGVPRPQCARYRSCA